MTAERLKQEFCDRVRDDGEYYDGYGTGLVLVVSNDGRRRQYRVRTGLEVRLRSVEAIGAASMWRLHEARAKAASACTLNVSQ